MKEVRLLPILYSDFDKKGHSSYCSFQAYSSCAILQNFSNEVFVIDNEGVYVPRRGSEVWLKLKSGKPIKIRDNNYYDSICVAEELIAEKLNEKDQIIEIMRTEISQTKTK